MWLWRFIFSLMIISSWNVNSVRARIENIKEYLNKFSPDIMMMQEIKTPNETYPYEEIKSLKYENYVFDKVEQFNLPLSFVKLVVQRS